VLVQEREPAPDITQATPELTHASERNYARGDRQGGKPRQFRGLRVLLDVLHGRRRMTAAVTFVEIEPFERLTP
jgi:hypothetical protein